MMDMRNRPPFPRAPFEGGRGFRPNRAVPAGRFSQYVEDGARTAGNDPDAVYRNEPLLYEPEDGMSGMAVPIADPPEAEMRAMGHGENVPGTCGGADVLAGYPLAMVYAPDQPWRALYDGDEALAAGTLFRELDFPFCPGCRKSGR